MTNDIQLCHILVAYRGARQASVDRTRAEAQTRAADIVRQLQAGVPMDVLADLSDEPFGARNGGRVTVPCALVFAPFVAAADLEVGQTGEVVETEYGFHIIRRLG